MFLSFFSTHRKGDHGVKSPLSPWFSPWTAGSQNRCGHVKGQAGNVIPNCGGTLWEHNLNAHKKSELQLYVSHGRCGTFQKILEQEHAIVKSSILLESQNSPNSGAFLALAQVSG